MDPDQFCTDEVCICGLCGECDCGYDGHICQDHEDQIVGTLTLFSALENVIRRHRDVGAPRQVLRDRLIYNAVARLGVGENTAIIFDLLWPKEEAS